jgi:Mrp family chromosome partitioning ATPase
VTAAPTLGRVITFYSYKGGTGRSMALANIAWVLAAAGRRVLAIDWDLEAPGLHRYFRPFLIDDELTATEGLMDLVDAYTSEAIKPADDAAKADPNWFLQYADISDHIVSVNFPHFPAGGKLDLLPAGKQGDGYATTVSSFNWQNFYDRLGGGGFFEAVKQRARQDYDYVLIDSRTGVSDTAGICSVQMPDSLVVCFTYNNQSIKGAAAVARSARATHKRMVEEKLALRRGPQTRGDQAGVAETPPPYRVFPVPMRVDTGESERLAVRQSFAQRVFADMVDHVDVADVTGEYWLPVEIPYTVFYAYEEVLAPFKDNAGDAKTVLAALLRLTRFVTDGDVVDYHLALSAEERQRYLEAFARIGAGEPAKPAAAQVSRETDEQVVARMAEAALASLAEPDRANAPRVLLRLVRVGSDAEGGRYSPIRVPLGDFSQQDRTIIEALVSFGVLAVGAREDVRSTERWVALADPRLLGAWRRLLDWIEADRSFLVWRQQLRVYLADWEGSGQDPHALLSGRLFSEADLMSVRRGDDLSPAEPEYIAASREKATTVAAPPAVPARPISAEPDRRPIFQHWATAIVIALIVAGASVALFLRSPGGPATPADPRTGPPSIGPSILVPRLIALSSTEARAAAEAAGLKVVMTDGTTDGPLLEGIVVAQTPREREVTTSGAVVRLTVSSLTTTSPTLTGMTLTTALKELSAQRLNLGKTESRYVADAKVDTIIAQDPAAGTNLASGAAVNVTVARAAQLSDFKIGIYYVENTPSKDVADRVRSVVRRAGAEADVLPRPASFFVGRLAATRNEIRYGVAEEAVIARDLQTLLEKTGNLPRFAARSVRTESRRFISVFILPETPAAAQTYKPTANE